LKWGHEVLVSLLAAQLKGLWKVRDAKDVALNHSSNKKHWAINNRIMQQLRKRSMPMKNTGIFL